MLYNEKDIVITTSGEYVIIKDIDDTRVYNYEVHNGLVSWRISEEDVQELITKYFDDNIVSKLLVLLNEKEKDEK